jgi:pyridoxal phosphate enzyme (YggS family)
MTEPTAEEIRANLEEVTSRLLAAHQKHCQTLQEAGELPPPVPRLVAISKTKSPACVQSAYNAGCRIFGENYAQELIEKAVVLPRDIQWHFVGHLQSNKVKDLIGRVKNLSMVETVDSEKLSMKLNQAVEQSWPSGARLNVLVQVNTSGEESKSGVKPADAVGIANFIVASCPNLAFRGLMTIGMPDYSSTPENFRCLSECRRDVAKALGVDAASLELSMGMSGDFENAIHMGSTNVRVGSSIFGPRHTPSEELNANAVRDLAPSTQRM